MQDDEFGRFTRLDYVILVIAGVLVPILAMILGAFAR